MGSFARRCRSTLVQRRRKHEARPAAVESYLDRPDELGHDRVNLILTHRAEEREGQEAARDRIGLRQRPAVVVAVGGKAMDGWVVNARLDARSGEPIANRSAIGGRREDRDGKMMGRRFAAQTIVESKLEAPDAV